MTESEKKRLYYRRQYLLASELIECPFENNTYKITGDYTLYSHIDLPVTVFEHQNVKIFLLGDVFDYRNPEWSNHEIVRGCFKPDLNAFIEETFHLTGRFVFIHSSENGLFIFNDVSAARKIFYSNSNRFWVSSQPHLLARTLGYNYTENKEIIDYYHSTHFVNFFNANIGNLTIYDEITQLLPNHYLDILNKKVVRFWPVKPIVRRTEEEVALESAAMIKGYAKSLANRYKLMIPITAGKDSRTLFAAFKNIDSDIYYYINKYANMSDKSTDIFIPQSMFKKLGKEFHIETFKQEIDPEFEKIYVYNNPFASTSFLPVVYHYYTRFPDRVNLPGNIASAGLEHFKFPLKNPDGYELARLNYGIQHYDFAVKYYDEWLKEARPIYRKYNLNPVSLFYWEERLANWGTQISTDKDIAQEDINPYNSHLLVTKILSLKDRIQENPSYPLHKEILRHLWSGYEQFPINPGMISEIKRITFKAGLLTPFYKIKFILNL